MQISVGMYTHLDNGIQLVAEFCHVCLVDWYAELAIMDRLWQPTQPYAALDRTGASIRLLGARTTLRKSSL